MPDFPFQKKTPLQLLPFLAGLYLLFLFLLLGNQSLPFPLNDSDFRAVNNAWGIPGERVPDSWVAEELDGWLVHFFPQKLYVPMQLSRRFSMALAGLGLVVWAWRALGAVPGLWMALLALGFMPLRLCGISYASQAFGLAFYIWGCCLIFPVPWSKTGGVENAAGGFLLGASSLAAPWAWLYSLAILLRISYSRPFRSRLQRGFWWGLVCGLLPGLIWLADGGRGGRIDLGIHLETLVPGKIQTAFYLIRDGWGLPVFLLALLGIRVAGSLKGSPLSWWVDLVWPLPVSFLLGYGDSISLAQAGPGILFLSLAGIQRVGKLFVNRTEQVVLPTFLVLLLAYHMFFAGLREVRDWQAYARENQGLADLVRENVPPGASLALFSKSSLVALIDPYRPESYLVGMVPTQEFNRGIEDLVRYLSQRIERRGSLWMAPKQFREVFAPDGEAILARLCRQFDCKSVIGQDQAELLEMNLPNSR